MTNHNKKKSDIAAMLDQLAELLLWQEPGAADRCFESIINEQQTMPLLQIKWFC